MIAVTDVSNYQKNFDVESTSTAVDKLTCFCDLKQALLKSEGKRLTLLSSFYGMFSILMMLGMALADVGQDVLGLIKQQVGLSLYNVTEVAIHNDQQLSDVLESSDTGTIIFDLVTQYYISSWSFKLLRNRKTWQLLYVF